MAATQLTASPVTVSARSLASLEGFRASSIKFSSLKPGTLRQNQFRRLVVKAASVVAPKVLARFFVSIHCCFVNWAVCMKNSSKF